MKQRVITALILALILTPVTIINVPWVFNIFQLLVVSMVVISTMEMLAMYEHEKPIKLSIKIVILILTLLTYINLGTLLKPINPTISHELQLITLNIDPIVVISLVTLVLLACMVFVDEFTGADIGKAFTIIYYVGLGAASITLLRYLGIRFIVYVALISFVTDIFAYIFGIKFGKHKMAPNISPKKSWEGAIAGSIIATLIASAFAMFYGYIFTPNGFLGSIFNPADSEGVYLITIFDNFTDIGHRDLWLQALVIVPITFFGTIAGQIGDLVASKFKRTYQIKDFGNIMPGHGGILDRFDSIMFIGILFLSIFILMTYI